MSHIRIETVPDPDSGMIVAEAYFEPTNALIVRSEPIFTTEQEAEDEVIEVLRRAWPDRAPRAVDPTIGV